MTDERLAAIEARHPHRDHTGRCFEGYVIDGSIRYATACDTAIVIARLREVEAERFALVAAMDAQHAGMDAVIDAAEADAKALAEHGHHDTGCHRWPSEGVPCDCGWSAALAAHRERVKP